MEHLTLPVLDSGETKVVGKEVLEVERREDGGLTLLHSPAYVWGVAGGDTIDLDDAELSGFRLRSRGGNVAIVVTLKDDDGKKAPIVHRLIQSVLLMGGTCDGGPEKVLVFTIPVHAGFGPIEAIFDGFRAGQDGASWWYGNVLDRKDQPIGWWRSQGRGRAGL